jgi:hypothetical protein
MTILVSHCAAPTSVLYTGRTCKLCVNLFNVHNYGLANFFTKFSSKNFGYQVRKAKISIFDQLCRLPDENKSFGIN